MHLLPNNKTPEKLLVSDRLNLSSTQKYTSIIHVLWVEYRMYSMGRRADEYMNLVIMWIMKQWKEASSGQWLHCPFFPSIVLIYSYMGRLLYVWDVTQVGVKGSTGWLIVTSRQAKSSLLVLPLNSDSVIIPDKHIQTPFLHLCCSSLKERAAYINSHYILSMHVNSLNASFLL